MGLLQIVRVRDRGTNGIGIRVSMPEDENTHETTVQAWVFSRGNLDEEDSLAV
jgi:hypothetical protein